MYLDHFGLRVNPFALTPDSGLFFTGGQRGDILEQLQLAIRAGEGLITVVGEPGSGKTMLCRTLCLRLPKNIQVALLLNPNFSPKNVVPALLQEFRLASGTKKDRLAERQTLLNHLVNLNRQGEQALLLIDEAHILPVATLEALRLLGNLETGRTKLLQIVLFGQPALDHTLQTSAGRHILERCSTRLTLPPLSLADTELYLHRRIHATGYTGENLFSARAIQCIHRASKGRIHQINNLAHKALQAACHDKAQVIATHHVKKGLLTSASSKNFACWYRPALASAGSAALLVGGMVLHSWAINPSVPLPIEHTSNHKLNMPYESLQLEQARREQQNIQNELLQLDQAMREQENMQNVATLMIPAQEQPLATETLFQAEVQPRNPEPGPMGDEAFIVQAAPRQESRPSSTTNSIFATPLQPYLKANDPMRDKILAAHQWLENGNDTHFTIQLILLRAEPGIEILQKQLSAMTPPFSEDDLKIFRTKNDKLLIFLHEFASKQEGMELLNRLPLPLQAGKPRVRTIGGAKMTIQKLAFVTPDVIK
ncbi:MAG: AAA family ATPase [Magnetococcus sp. YQC-5]